MRGRKRRQRANSRPLASVLAVREVAELLHIHINTVRNWGDRGLMPVYRVGPRRDRRFRRKDVVALLEDSGNGGAMEGQPQDINRE